MERSTRQTSPLCAPELSTLPERSAVRVSRALAPKETALCHSVPVPPTPLPTSDVDVYFETSADDNEHARFQKAKEQLEIRHRNRMDRVNCSLPVSAWRWALGDMVFIVEEKGHHLSRLSREHVAYDR